jgi:putative spermidine/putrescine transport system substrate-binding protein/mannopine transport system substrate-binding protein
MTTSDGHRRSAVSRRRFLQAAAIGFPVLARTGMSRAQDRLAGKGEVVVFSFGGGYTQTMRKNVYEPFTKATGINVIDVTADFSEPQMRAMHAAGRVDWDVSIPDGRNVPALRAAGMFVPIDYSLWDDESLKGVPATHRTDQAVVKYQSGTVLVYDARAFPKGGPANWVDFWNVNEFPGPRGLLGPNGRHDLSYALVADGVPLSQRWPMTDDKIDRALRKLDQIKPHITKWWTSGGEPPQLLMNRELAMTSCYDGRALSLIRQGAPLKIVWDGGYVSQSWWTILKGGPNTQNAQKFIAFVNRAPIAAALTQGLGYPAPNTNQFQYLPAEIIPLLNNAPENVSKVVIEDAAWLASTRPDGKTNFDHMQERWLAWRARA